MKKKPKVLKTRRTGGTFSAYSAADRKIIRAELERIERTEGAVRTSRVLELSRDPSHPLHPFVFKLTDRQAAERWRLRVVRQLCQTVRIEFTDDTGKVKHSVPAFVSCRIVSARETEEGAQEQFIERAYRSAEKAMADPRTRQELIDEALRQVEMWQARYRSLTELGDVFDAINRAKVRRRA